MDQINGFAVIGNLNVGKTTLLSRMCDRDIHRFNIPDSTIKINACRIKNTDKHAFDTPGICSIFSANEDERATRTILIPDKDLYNIEGIILVADAKNMKRSLAITLQYAEFGLPMILDINMIDEAHSRGIDIDTARLSQQLGIDVVTTVSREGIGVSKLVSGLSNVKTPGKLVEYPAWIEEYLSIVEENINSTDVPARAIGLLLLAEDKDIEVYIENAFGPGMLTLLKELAGKYIKEATMPCNLLLANIYNIKAKQIIDEVQTIEPPSKNTFLIRFGDWCTQVSTGIPIAVLILWLMYIFIGSFGATYLVDMINGTVFEGFLIPFTERLVAPIPSEFIREMFVDPDFGILPTGIFLALGLVLPVLFCFYTAFGILEESGYLPRLSVLLDKAFQKIGLNGKGVIPLVMGFSCVTMAILTTRLLDTEKEKNIVSFLLFLTMPCAPLIAVMFIVLDDMPASASIAVFSIIFSQIFIAGFLANKILPGARTPLFMEIPPMRLPKLSHIIKRAGFKTYFFMKEALPVFIFASLVVFLYQRMGGLAALEQMAGPFLSNIMGLPEKSIQVFIKTMIRRESGATELQHLSTMYTNLQLVVNLLVMTFITPCINSVIVLFKERGIRVGSIIICAVTIYAIAIGSIVNHTCHFLGITFT